MLHEIEARRSVRRYDKTRDVSDADVMALIASARLAPSGENTQPWNFIIVRSAEMREKIAKADNNQMWLCRAPVFIVSVADMKGRIEDFESRVDEDSPYFELKEVISDTAVATEHILLEAQHMGLATCWTTWFTQDDIRKVLEIPENKYVCGVISLGYPGESPDPRPRRPIEDLVHFEKW